MRPPRSRAPSVRVVLAYTAVVMLLAYLIFVSLSLSGAAGRSRCADADAAVAEAARLRTAHATAAEELHRAKREVVDLTHRLHFAANQLDGALTRRAWPAEHVMRGPNWPSDCKPARVFDCVSFMHEIALFEVRVGELWDAVDFFIVVEAETTFQGKPKAAQFWDLVHNSDFPATFLTKVLYYNCGKLKGSKKWDWENDHRICMLYALRYHGLRKNDLVIYGDVDEIPDAKDVGLLRDVVTSGLCNPPGQNDTVADLNALFPVGLRHVYYQYNFRHVNTALDWRTDFHYFDGFDIDRIGRGTHKRWLTGRGWHCSFCFPRVADYVKKLQSYSHNEELFQGMLDAAYINKVVCEGLPIYKGDRTHRPNITTLSYADAVRHAPPYLVRNRDRFPFLLPERAPCNLQP